MSDLCAIWWGGGGIFTISGFLCVSCWGGGGMMGVAVYGLFYASCMCVCVRGGGDRS